jgi:hypothetical protein
VTEQIQRHKIADDHKKKAKKRAGGKTMFELNVKVIGSFVGCEKFLRNPTWEVENSISNWQKDLSRFDRSKLWQIPVLFIVFQRFLINLDLKQFHAELNTNVPHTRTNLLW